MNKVFFVLFASLCLLGSCSKDNSESELSAQSFKLDTLTFAHSMKGWELYSWEKNGEWNFSILMGTNRGKTADEVFNNKIAVKGVSALKSLLMKMPAQESIFWSANKNQFSALSMPSESIIEDIRTFCQQRELNLNIYFW